MLQEVYVYLYTKVKIWFVVNNIINVSVIAYVSKYEVEIRLILIFLILMSKTCMGVCACVRVQVVVDS